LTQLLHQHRFQGFVKTSSKAPDDVGEDRVEKEEMTEGEGSDKDRIELACTAASSGCS
jgi:hypothetical protein